MLYININNFLKILHMYNNNSVFFVQIKDFHFQN